jgi:hypothetical protein
MHLTSHRSSILGANTCIKRALIGIKRNRSNHACWIELARNRYLGIKHATSKHVGSSVLGTITWGSSVLGTKTWGSSVLGTITWGSSVLGANTLDQECWEQSHGDLAS